MDSCCQASYHAKEKKMNAVSEISSMLLHVLSEFLKASHSLRAVDLIFRTWQDRVHWNMVDPVETWELEGGEVALYGREWVV